MDKRTETISFRAPVELSDALQHLAFHRRKTLSDFVCGICDAYVSDQYQRFLDLSRAFSGWKDLPRKPSADTDWLGSPTDEVGP